MSIQHVPDPRVLIVGAGPTGLVLALWLTHQGVPVRIVDKAATAGTTSRAFAVQARTLELYTQINGLAEDIVAAGIKVESFDLWRNGRSFVRLAVADIGRGLSPFPYVLVLPQDSHEQILERHLAAAGVAVERRTELVAMGAEGIATLRGPEGRQETAAYRFICGCDGAHSVVRKRGGFDFPGGTYAQPFYVADLTTDDAVNLLRPRVSFDTRDVCLLFPMRAGTVRLVGSVPAAAAEKPLAELSFSDVAATALRNVGISASAVNWFSAYRVHHRAAARFRAGQVFLLGDAAHIHSPAGGQGMNTGIGDAINLAWKIREVLAGRADDRLLESYHEERHAFAVKLVDTTDRAFGFITQAGWRGWAVRRLVMPLVLPLLLRFSFFKKIAFNTVSQIRVHYQKMFLSHGSYNNLVGGNRVPDGVSPLCWSLKLSQNPDAELQNFCKKNAINVSASLPSGFCLVRPDGYIACAGAEARLADLQAYFAARGLRFSL